MYHKVSDAVEHIPQAAKLIADAGAIGIAWGAFFTDVVPAIASLLSVVWLTVQLYTWVINKRWRRK